MNTEEMTATNIALIFGCFLFVVISICFYKGDKTTKYNECVDKTVKHVIESELNFSAYDIVHICSQGDTIYKKD